MTAAVANAVTILGPWAGVKHLIWLNFKQRNVLPGCVLAHCKTINEEQTLFQKSFGTFYTADVLYI